MAKAYISVFPSDKSEAVLESVRKSAQSIRYELAKIVRYQLRKTPELSFFLDDSMDYLENIDSLLGKPRQDTETKAESEDASEK